MSKTAGTTISLEFKALLRQLKLTPVLTTLPERLELARQQKLGYYEFLELVLSDEAARRSAKSLQNRAERARLDPAMTLERWDTTAEVTYDHELWRELTTLRFVEERHNAIIMGPVGVGKTFFANALGHIACRRGMSVLFIRAEKMLRELKASRLSGTHERELRRLISVDVLIIDDFALERMDAMSSHDVFDIFLERHRAGSMILTSNREPKEWLALVDDPMLAQSAIDRIQNASFELVIEGESYRKRQKPSVRR